MGFKQHSCLILILLLVSGICLRVQAQNLVTTCDPNDLRALQGFMAVLQNPPDNWGVNSSSNCCEWEGVTCNSSASLGFGNSSEDGRVVVLELPRKRLNGRLSDSLGFLDQLRTLNLSHNFLRGSLPLSLFNLSNLQALDLSFNDFYGPVPDFANLSSIQHLDMSQNSLNGSLPGRICSGGSSQLKVVKLDENYFSGEVPSVFGDCGSLEHLSLRMNDLSGVSEDLFRLQKISDLILSDNKLRGQLSRGIGNLTNLVRLDISSNGYSGTIPNVFHKLGKFQFFVAHTNEFVGSIPDSLSNSPTLTLLNLRNNSLVGPINLNCSAMVKLVSLDLGTNQFTGRIPNYLPSCHLLNNVNLARNNFNGEIPESFKNFHSLSYFSLSNTTNTNLSSALRILQQCKNLTTLVLSLNFHDDMLPADPDLHFRRLKILVIANCRLTGSVPQWLSKSQKLQLLDLSWNQLVGSVPGWFGDFEYLFYLDISNNSFTGDIPKTLTGLPSLVNRDSPIEEPSPDFPFFTKRNGNARWLQYNQLWSFPPTLDLSHNHLSGPIWPEFGNLRKLHVLDLKFNNLSGTIPSSLSGMSSLENLDLSHNKLSGTLPSTLARLTFLSRFSVAFNNLHGPIPTRSQFQTFPNSSFEGNDLCGDHWNPCASTDILRGEPTASVESRISGGGFVDVNSIGVGLGVGTAFGFVLGAVLFQVLTRKYGLYVRSH